MKNLHNRYKRYREWKLEPHQVAPLSEEQHECATCGTHYEGNYCPRCGQSARIGRYSFKKAILLFLDVWGLGNRGMFRSIRDLILRPGYMIRDYLRGMQMAYFPPFKLLFLLTALLLIVDSGVNLKRKNYLASYHEQTVNTDKSIAKKDKKKEITSAERWNTITDLYIVKIREFRESSPAFFWLSLLFVFSLPIYIFFWKSPNIPDLRFSELLIALVYIWGMQNIYEIVFTFLGVYGGIGDVVWLLCIIPLKQLSGYKWWRTTLYVLLSYLAALVLLFAAILSVAQIQLYLEA